MTKVTSDLDVEVLLSPIVSGPRKLASLVEIFEEEGNCLIKLKKYLPGTIWSQINNKVHEWQGVWSRKKQSWIVPLEAGK